MNGELDEEVFLRPPDEVYLQKGKHIHKEDNKIPVVEDYERKNLGAENKGVGSQRKANIA